MHFKKILDKGYPIKDFNKDDVIYEPGQMARFVYFIISGEVRMVSLNHQGKEFIQGIFKSGQYFGEPALLVDKAYLAFTIANTKSKILQVNKADFIKLIQTDTAFAMNVIQNLSNRLFYKSMMLEELANESAEHRILTLIKHLTQDLPEGKPLNKTRKELAAMAGLRVETVIRIIKILEQNKELVVRNGKIYLN